MPGSEASRRGAAALVSSGMSEEKQLGEKRLFCLAHLLCEAPAAP